jgi:hypothetical protein
VGIGFAESRRMGSFLSLPNLLAFVSLLVVVGVGDQTETEPPAGRAFATAALAEVSRGGRFARIEITEVDEWLALSFVFAHDESAQKLSLAFDQDGTPETFRREEVPRPEERRVYRLEQDILEALEDGEVLGLEVGCEEYLLVTGKGGADKTPLHVIPVEPDDYHVASE